MKPRSHEATKPRRQRQSRPIRPSLFAICYFPLRSPLPTAHCPLPTTHYPLPTLRHPAFTLVELLVVIVIIAILVSAVLVASSTLINNSRVNNTKAVLQLVNDAIQEFKRERPAVVNAKRTVGPQTVSYLQRYGPYPPDELEVFFAGTGDANPVSNSSLAPGGAKIQPPPPYQKMDFFTTSVPAHDAAEHRDLAAMIVAIEMLTESASAILAKIPDRNRTEGVVDGNGNPAQFLDRPPLGNNYSDADLQVRYIVDDWGVPLGYLAQRDWQAAPQPPNANHASSNHADWNKASTQIIRQNGGEPVIFSWGPDGKEQLTRDVMSDQDENPASLIADFAKDDRYKVVHPMNADNIYVNDALRDKLAGETQ